MKNSFGGWLTGTELGRYLLAREQDYFERAVADVFGYHAVQVGVPEMDCLRGNRIPWQCRVAEAGEVDVRCDPAFLPFENRSLDLLVMPHVLDFTTLPHQVLREADRVLMPEGRLILTGFNPLSLWGVRRLIQGRESVPWNGSFLTQLRVKDWLTLLDLELEEAAFMAYAPPFARGDWLCRCDFMEDAGERWWPLAAGVYGIEAVKRQRGMRLITPNWKQKQAKNKGALGVVAGNERQHTHKRPDATERDGAPSCH
ncbi:methyltransferase domain-containing protein [Chromobacterium subtsugae]|uniref:Methyltransferase domain-containing protein n=1 Tax=Chromobacterium subtsugae TaxID=251747 RepID=A0ABS7F995_9NEIS|nr:MULTISPECIES: methyltransferase domain-containing protein [Chromobacterium]KUM02600.1 methyltransferase type 11 [Chromobacterium subtsugae]KZE87986.1 methyltransferase type 11 [Chromobacterium sp. F49]MBW7565485.1 methyltransferase domain-containing protein [Chromobacterium subtsugae]MBW8286665.1 methyltransferase domain-containing protein [Chromobacterium subtsugae]OBU84649.1 methyltransferase type 11 [Chromobacterium subtsugae]